MLDRQDTPPSLDANTAFSELAIPWLIIFASDPVPAWRAAARTELAARLNRRVYAPIRGELLQHHHPQVRRIVAESLGVPVPDSGAPQ